MKKCQEVPPFLPHCQDFSWVGGGVVGRKHNPGAGPEAFYAQMSKISNFLPIRNSGLMAQGTSKDKTK